MLSPSYLYICLIEAPDGYFAVVWLGLVTGASDQEKFNWECTLSKKEKRKKKKETDQWTKEKTNKM